MEKNKKMKIITVVLAAIALLFPYRLSFPGEDEAFKYSSVLFSLERAVEGSTEPQPVSNSDEWGVVSYSVTTKAKLLVFTVFDKQTDYEGWCRT